MKRVLHRASSLVLALALVLSLAPQRGRAKLEGVYLGAVNDRLLVDMGLDAMPFWSEGIFYVPSLFFEGTDIDVHYVKNSTMNTAMLYDSQRDLRCDLETGSITDRKGNNYNGRILQKNGRVFLPIDLLSKCFAITWVVLDTDTAPLVRIKSSAAILSDKAFVSAATDQMRGIYAQYERAAEEPGGKEEEGIIHATQGQKVYLLARADSAQGAMDLMDRLGSAGATLLVPPELFADGDLLRSIVARGHGVALLLENIPAEDRQETFLSAREALWDAALLWLDQAWYPGEEDSGLRELGAMRVTARLDWDKWGVATDTLARKLLTTIGKYRGDIGVLLGPCSRGLDGLDTLLEGLEEGGYLVFPWRPTP